MTFQHQRIVRDSGAPFVAGETFQVARTETGLPAGRTVTSVRLLIKASPGAADAAAIVNKNITTAAVAGTGQVTDNGADDASAAWTFEFTENDSANSQTLTKLGAKRTYYYEQRVTLDNGDESVYETGTIKLARSLKDT